MIERTLRGAVEASSLIMELYQRAYWIMPVFPLFSGASSQFLGMPSLLTMVLINTSLLIT